MKSTLKILKNNVFTIIVIIVFIIGMFALSYLKRLYWDNNNKATYGDRIEDVKNHVINEDEIKEIKESIKSDENILDVNYDLEGRIINLTITVKDDMKVKSAKDKATQILDVFSEEDLSYYSIQIYFVKEDPSLNDFPIMGYKHYSSSEISWTKDREATNNEN